jgi:hypothetical protein
MLGSNRLPEAQAINRNIYSESPAPAVMAGQEGGYSTVYGIYRRLDHHSRDRFLC